MVGLYRRLKWIIRPLVPVFVGVFVGMSMSLLAVTHSGGGTCSMFGANSTLEGNSQRESYKAKILEKLPSNQMAPPPKKVVRPRYASEELGIRIRFYVCVIVGNSTGAWDRAVAINNTIYAAVPTLEVFKSPFQDGKLPTPEHLGANVIETPGAMPLVAEAIQHIFKRQADIHDNFLFLSDESFVDARRLLDLVKSTSVSVNIHAGFPSSFPGVCDLRGGLLLSRRLVNMIAPEMPVCVTAFGEDEWTLPSRCLLKHDTVISHCNSAGGFDLPSATVTNEKDLEKDMASITSAGVGAESTLPYLLYPIKDPGSICTLHTHFNKRRLVELDKKVEKIRSDILRTIELAGENGTNRYPWPEEVVPPRKPKNRHEVVRWTYIKDGKVYFPDDNTQVRNITELEQIDINEVVSHIKAEHMPAGSTFSSVTSVHSRFDEDRGMEYKFNLNVTVPFEAKDNTIQYRHTDMFFEAVRPLGEMEVQSFEPVNVATPTKPTYILLPLKAHEQDSLETFLNSFASVCLGFNRKKPKATISYKTIGICRLVILYVHTSAATKIMATAQRLKKASSSSGGFSEAKNSVMSFQRRFKELLARAEKLDANARKGKILLEGGHLLPVLQSFEVYPQTGSQVEIADIIAQRLPSQNVALLTSVDSSLDSDLIRRVSANSEKGQQVYIPVCFWQYKLAAKKLAAKYLNQTQTRLKSGNKKPLPKPHIPISRRSGFFDSEIIRHVAFYVEDYLKGRSVAEVGGARLVADVFARGKKLRMFRAVEPGLVVAHRDPQCPVRPLMNSSADEVGEYRSCLTEVEDHSGSKEDLADIYLDKMFPTPPPNSKS